MFWEHEGNAAVRIGKWKLVRKYPGPWELYDMDADRTEMHDLAAQHPDKVAKLVLLAPAYSRAASAKPPGEIPIKGVPMNTQSRAEFDANWDRQVGCPDQYDRGASQSVWTNMLASDPVGATWGPGVRRAPVTTSWGWTTDVVKETTIPTLMVFNNGSLEKRLVGARSKGQLMAELAQFIGG